MKVRDEERVRMKLRDDETERMKVRDEEREDESQRWGGLKG